MKVKRGAVSATSSTPELALEEDLIQLPRITATLTLEAYNRLNDECESRKLDESARATYGRVLSELILRGLPARRSRRESAA